MRSHLRADRVSLPRVDRRRVGGTVYKYHRVTRAALPTDVPEDHPKFTQAWAAEEAKTGAPKRIDGAKGSLAATCRLYLASRQHADLSPDYRRAIRSHIEAIAEAYGTAHVTLIKPRHIKADLAKLPSNPGRARRKAWRQIFTFAERNSMITEDPVASVRAPAKVKTEGHLPWTKDDIAAFRKHWSIDTPQRLAFELTFWTAARRNDAAVMSRRMIGPDGVLTYKQGKTKNPAHIPMFCALPAFADKESHGHLVQCLDAQAPELMLVVTQTGKPRSPKAFGPWLVAAAQAAGVHGKSAHGLRKSRLTQIAESGGTVHAIMSWGGHVTLSEAQHYITTANRKSAIMGAEQEQNAAQDPTPAAQSAGKV